MLISLSATASSGLRRSAQNRPRLGPPVPAGARPILFGPSICSMTRPPMCCAKPATRVALS
eukprot:14136751-Alexandrium_andersonii.AAC.1